MSHHQFDLKSSTNQYTPHPLTIEIEQRLRQTTFKGMSLNKKEIFNDISVIKLSRSLFNIIQEFGYSLTDRHKKTSSRPTRHCY
jgi:hypothetical protein